jgi:hypothetical protein
MGAKMLLQTTIVAMALTLHWQRRTHVMWRCSMWKRGCLCRARGYRSPDQAQLLMLHLNQLVTKMLLSSQRWRHLMLCLLKSTAMAQIVFHLHHGAHPLARSGLGTTPHARLLRGLHVPPPAQLIYNVPGSVCHLCPALELITASFMDPLSTSLQVSHLRLTTPVVLREQIQQRFAMCTAASLNCLRHGAQTTMLIQARGFTAVRAPRMKKLHLL